MNGEIGFQSTEGVGTEFWVLLPGAAAAALPATAETRPPVPVRATDPNALIALTYVSAAIKPLAPAELETLIQSAKAFNATVGVTGMLLYHGGNFFQYLEGPASGVEQVMERVQHARGHRHLILQTREPITERQFADWNMDLVNLTRPQVLKNAYWIHTLKTAWRADEGHSKGIRLLLDFVAQMTDDNPQA